MEKSEVNRLVKHAKLTERVLARREMITELEEIEVQLLDIKAVLQGETDEHQQDAREQNLEQDESEEPDEEELEDGEEVEESPESVESAIEALALRKATKVVIGVAGAQHRIGCTHTSIMIACYLRRQGFKVALMEFGRDDAFQYFEKNIDKKIDVYRDVSAEGMLQILTAKYYGFIVVDFGAYSDCDTMMFSRSDVKILLSGAKPWETKYMRKIFEEKEEVLRQMDFVFNFTDMEQQRNIRKEMEQLGKIYFLPMKPDPFDVDEIGELKELLQEYLKEPTESRWVNIFRRRWEFFNE